MWVKQSLGQRFGQLSAQLSKVFSKQKGQSSSLLKRRVRSSSPLKQRGQSLFRFGQKAQPLSRANSLFMPIALCASALGLAGIIRYNLVQRQRRQSLKTAPDVDLERYAGSWFEIARLPSPEEKRAVNIRATYTLRPDGQINVLNECELDGFNGTHREAKALAWIPDPAYPAKLKVKFGVFSADYWILELGEHYEYAVVGTPNRHRLWILSRQPQLRKEVFEGIVARMQEQGFDLERLILAPQNVHKPIGQRTSNMPARSR